MDIGLVAWNTRDELRDALESVRRFGGGRRTVVVDNASSDGTADMVSAEFPDVELVAETENRGFAAGANRLLERTGDADLLLLNADIALTQGAVERLEAALAAHPRAAAVGPRLAGEDGRVEHSALAFPTLGLAATVNLGLYGLRSAEWRAQALVPGTGLPERTAKVDWIIGAAMAIRREAVRESGPFDESLFMYAEDLEWCWRANRAGWELWYEPAATIVHLGNRSGSQVYGDTRTAAWLQSTYRVTRRTHGRAWTAAYFALNAAGAGARYAAARVRDRARPSERTRAAVAEWRPHVRYHFGGLRPLDRR
jgi:GT2 family glycosyltransferase